MINLNINGHNLGKINDPFRAHFKCKKCDFEVVELLTGRGKPSGEYVSITRKNFKYLESDNFTCDDYIIKSIIE